MRELAHLLRVRSADAELQWPADGRSKLKRADAAHHLLEFRPLQRGEDPLLNGWPNLESLGDNNRLREEVVGELLVQRQVKANGATTDIEGPALDVGIAVEDLFEIVDALCVSR